MKTIGQHSYLWSSADVGDAHLVSTEPCETLESAIIELKAAILKLSLAQTTTITNLKVVLV